MTTRADPRLPMTLTEIFRHNGARNYMVIAFVALLLYYVQMVERGSDSGVLIALLLAVPGLIGRWVISPFLFILLTTYLLIDPELAFLMPIYDSFTRTWPRSYGRPNRDFEVADLLLTGSVLVYLIAQYRLLSIAHLGMPDDPPPRRKGQPEPTPPRRPPGLIDDRELFWLFGMAAFSTLMGTVIWLGIARYENGARLGSVWGIEKPVARGMLFIWMFMTGVIMLQVYLRTRSLYRMTRREARLMLQDGLWQETRREQERIYRWKKWFRQQSEG